MVFLADMLAACLDGGEHVPSGRVRYTIDGVRPGSSVGHYLAAVGLASAFHSVDPSCRTRVSRWRFEVRSDVDIDDIAATIEATWAPKPCVTVHNSDTGLRPPTLPQRPTERLVDELLATTSDRLAQWRKAYTVGRQVWADAAETGAVTPDGKIADKAALITAARSRLPDDALGWLDATAYVWHRDPKKPRLVHPAICGTGGNFGRHELARWAVAAMLAIDAGSQKVGRGHRQVSLYPVGTGQREYVDLENCWFPDGTSWWRYALALEGAQTFGGLGLYWDYPVPPWQTRLGNDVPSGKAELWLPLWGEMTYPELAGLLSSQLIETEPRAMMRHMVSRSGPANGALRWVWDSDWGHYTGGVPVGGVD